jgi:hypothetical protein
MKFLRRAIFEKKYLHIFSEFYFVSAFFTTREVACSSSCLARSQAATICICRKKDEIVKQRRIQFQRAHVIILLCKLLLGFCRLLLSWEGHRHTVRKMDLILRSIERMLRTQRSMARKFKLQVLRRYNVKFYKKRNFTLDMQRLDKLKSTGGRRTNNPWIYSPWLYHCATGTHEIKAEF